MAPDPPNTIRPQDVEQVATAATRKGRELFFGLVVPLGVQTQTVENELRRALREARYSLVPTIKISKWLERAENSWLLQDSIDLNEVTKLERKAKLMDAGDLLRIRWNKENENRNGGDAGAVVAIGEIKASRKYTASIEKGRTNSIEAPNRAYLIDSLKHPDEVDRLKRTYGPAFISIGVYSPQANRKKALEGELDVDEESALVDTLMKRDEKDVVLGQRVGEAFFVTDFIVDATRTVDEIGAAFSRLVRLIFGDLHVTPEQSEYGMFLARAAQVRSGSLARQIGAAALRDDGTVASLGTNEVARAITGGQYWPTPDDSDKRDKTYIIPGNKEPIDTSDWWRKRMLSDVIELLKNGGHLAADLINLNAEARFEYLVVNPQTQVLAKSLISQDIDYVRAVHAEAAAIIDAGRHNVSLQGATLYTTTFPCHECARHIVASGIKKVVYLEPYPKSGVKVMFDDSIAVDPNDNEISHIKKSKVVFRTFVGVAPARYLEFFTVGNRQRKENGVPKEFDIATREPELPYYTPSIESITAAESLLNEKFLAFTKEQSNEKQLPDPR